MQTIILSHETLERLDYETLNAQTDRQAFADHTNGHYAVFGNEGCLYYGNDADAAMAILNGQG